MVSARPRLAVIAAMQQELRPLVKMLDLRRRGGPAPTLMGGSAGRVDVLAGITTMGVGPAGEFTEAVLRAARVDHVIGIGIVGGIGPSVAVGDLVVPDLVVDDETGKSYRPTPIDGHAMRGTLLTSDALISDKRGIGQLIQDGVVAVDMETAAIGAVCERHGVPWSVLRAVSDRADDEAVDDAVVGLAHPDGSADVAAIARFFVRHPARVPHLAVLARGMRTATQASAAAAAAACRDY